MSEPRTDAGRRLLADLEAMALVLDFPIDGVDAEPYGVSRTRDGIAEIEAEMGEAAALAGPGADRLREALRLVTRDCPACRDRETGCSDPVHLAARTALGEES